MATYYVDRNDGDDAETGTSPDMAWQTLGRVNRADLQPGDIVLLKAGDVHRETLKPSSSGTPEAPIVFGRYGEGPLPAISGLLDLTALPWQEHEPHLWSAGLSLASGQEPEKLLLAGQAAPPRAAVLEDLQRDGDWFWSDGTIYLLSHQPPAQAYRTIEVPALEAAILVRDRQYLRFEDLEIAGGRNGVLISDSTAITLVDLVVHDNAHNGVHLRKAQESTVSGGSIFANGVDGLGERDIHLGHGILVGTGTSGSRIVSVAIHDNAEDGVQFGRDSGDGNLVLAATIYGNREDGIDIKQGSQRLEGNCIRDNSENAVLVHKSADRIELEGNILRTAAGGNALDVSGGGHVVSLGNWYQGADSYTLHLHASAGDGSAFQGDIFLGGGMEAGAGAVVEGGAGHRFEAATFAGSNGGYVLRVSGEGTDVAIAGSTIAGERSGLLQVRDGASVALTGNLYASDLAQAQWLQLSPESGATMTDGGGQAVELATVLAELLRGAQRLSPCLVPGTAAIDPTLRIVVEAPGLATETEPLRLTLAFDGAVPTLVQGSAAPSCTLLVPPFLPMGADGPC